MTEAANQAAPSEASPQAAARATEPAPPLNITALFAEAASKSDLMWVEIPGDRAWPFWHAWDGTTVYAVSGPGEQSLPWVPDHVTLVTRSKDTGGRLLTVHATVQEIRAQDPEWETATQALASARLNATDDQVTRWAADCTVRAFRPFGTPVEAPGSYVTSSRSAPVPPSAATTSGWRPWHWRGRPRRRRGNRLPDEY